MVKRVTSMEHVLSTTNISYFLDYRLSDRDENIKPILANKVVG